MRELPIGAVWEDIWTGRKIEGGCSIEVEAPLKQIPLFSRNGRKFPIEKD